jgi:hypothetical protein
MKKITIIIALFFAAISTTFAQDAPREQTLMHGLGLSGVWFSSNTSFGQFNGKTEPFYGGMWGLEFGKKLTVGFKHEAINQSIDAFNKFDLQNNGIFVSYAPNADKSIHPIFTLIASNGALKVAENKSSTFVLQPQLGVEINVFRWFHLELDGGYRILSGNDIAGFSNSQFSGAYAEAKFKFGWSWGKAR